MATIRARETGYLLLLASIPSSPTPELRALALPPPLSAARPKRLRFLVFTLAGRIVSHGGRLVARIAAAAEGIAGLIAARAQLAALLLPRATAG